MANDRPTREAAGSARDTVRRVRREAEVLVSVSEMIAGTLERDAVIRAAMEAAADPAGASQRGARFPARLAALRDPMGVAIDPDGALGQISSFGVDADGDVDVDDFAIFQRCFNGPNQPPACAQ